MVAPQDKITHDAKQLAELDPAKVDRLLSAIEAAEPLEAQLALAGELTSEHPAASRFLAFLINSKHDWESIKGELHVEEEERERLRDIFARTRGLPGNAIVVAKRLWGRAGNRDDPVAVKAQLEELVETVSMVEPYLRGLSERAMAGEDVIEALEQLTRLGTSFEKIVSALETDEHQFAATKSDKQENQDALAALRTMRLRNAALHYPARRLERKTNGRDGSWSNLEVDLELDLDRQTLTVDVRVQCFDQQNSRFRERTETIIDLCASLVDAVGSAVELAADLPLHQSLLGAAIDALKDIEQGGTSLLEDIGELMGSSDPSVGLTRKTDLLGFEHAYDPSSEVVRLRIKQQAGTEDHAGLAWVEDFDDVIKLARGLLAAIRDDFSTDIGKHLDRGQVDAIRDATKSLIRSTRSVKERLHKRVSPVDRSE